MCSSICGLLALQLVFQRNGILISASPKKRYGEINKFPYSHAAKIYIQALELHNRRQERVFVAQKRRDEILTEVRLYRKRVCEAEHAQWVLAELHIAKEVIEGCRGLRQRAEVWQFKIDLTGDDTFEFRWKPLKTNSSDLIFVDKKI